MVVQHNLTAMNANRYLGINNSQLSKSLEKLSSGYAINRAGDNAAGLAVSEKMRAQISGLTQASKNAEDGISMVQTYEGALTETDSILQRMRSLAVQSANGSYDNTVDRVAIEQEFKQLNDELDQIADTDFNGVIVLNGGQMADGTKVDGTGTIDYTTATREAQQLGTAGGCVKGIGADAYTGTTDETVTFTAAVDADGKVTWTPSAGAAGTVTDSANKAGGFSYAGAVVNVDTTKVVTGDTIAIKFSAKTEAEGLTGKVIGSNTEVTSGTSTAAQGTLTISIADNAVKSDEIAEAINSLNGLTVKTTTGTDGATVASTTINGLSDPGAGKTATLSTLSDGGEVYIKGGDMTKIYYKAKGGTETQLAGLTAATFTASGTDPKATSATTVYNVTQASYTPATSSGVELVEPDNKVSQSNANDASTAKLTYSDHIALQVGARTKDLVDFTFSYDSEGIGELEADLNCTAKGLGTSELTLSTQEDANAAIDKIDNAINKVSMVRGTFGAIQNRLEHKINNLDTTNENLTAAESRIRDTDMAAEMMNFTKNQILSQASQSMLAQANQLPQGVLSLLQ